MRKQFYAGAVIVVFVIQETLKEYLKKKNKKELEFRYSRLLIQKYMSSIMSDI